jgi:hypothetical protein
MFIKFLKFIDIKYRRSNFSFFYIHDSKQTCAKNWVFKNIIVFKKSNFIWKNIHILIVNQFRFNYLSIILRDKLRIRLEIRIEKTN